MSTRNRHLLVLAVAATLAAPSVLAQDAKVTGKAIGPPAAQEATPRLPPPALPVAASHPDTAPSTQRLNESAPPLPPEVEEAAMNPSRPPPTNAEAAEPQPPAAGRATIRQRSKWAQLDVNGDGRISGTEGEGDADFKANFEMMDADKDGFITNTEFSSHAKAGHDVGNAEEEEEEKHDHDHDQ